MTHVPETGTRKWSRFIAPVSGECVMGISVEHYQLAVHLSVELV